MARQSRHQPNQAEETLHEIEESFDKLAAFVSDNRIVVFAVAGAILLAALGYDRYEAFQVGKADRAAAALAEARDGYMRAMGAGPNDMVIAEPANPEIARSTREEYAKRFAEIGAEHAGTAAGSLAMFEAGELHEALGAPHLARDAWQAGIDSAEPGTALRALILVRLGRAFEDEGQWAEAAAAHLEAGRTESYPERWVALGNAGRCFIEDGQPDRALEILAELEAGAALERIPGHTAARLRELRASRNLEAPAES